MPNFDRGEEHFVERKEDRHLQKHGKAACRRIDLVLLIEAHDLLLLFHLIVFVALLNALHLRRDLPHPRHGAVAGVGKGEEDGFHDKGEKQDGHTIIASQHTEEVHEPVDRPGEEEEHPPIDSLVEIGNAQLFLIGLEGLNLFGPCKKVRG